MDIMAHAPEGKDPWLLHKISFFNVPVKRSTFPKESSISLREALNVAFSFALSLYTSSPLAFGASVLFVLFPRLILRLLLDGCQGRLATIALVPQPLPDAPLRKRCRRDPRCP